MLGKKMNHKSKGRLASIGHDNGKASTSGITTYNKPTKISKSISVGKTNVDISPIPYIKIQDNAVHLPCFTAIAARSADKPIGMDELDSLQLELESLLGNTALRIRYFQSDIENIDTNESKTKVEICPIPYIKIQDNAVHLPCFTAIAARSADRPIRMDELDSLQLELETLLGNTALRLTHFQSEIESINTNESKIKKKGKVAGKQSQYPVKRKFPEDKLVKTKDCAELPDQSIVPKFKKISNVSSTGSNNYSNDIVNADNSIKLKISQFALPKNSIPYKFWRSVDPYCAPVTLDDTKFLESLLAQSSNTTLPPIPPLGRHYSEMWADEHLAQDQNASNPNKPKSSMSPDASSTCKKPERPHDNMITGPLMQRLVSALMEENLNNYEVPDLKVEQTTNTKSSYGNTLTLEKNLRKELVEQGILDPEDLHTLNNPADDEILEEIKKCEAELTAVKKDNCRNLKYIIELSKQEMIRLNLKKQLDQVDTECVDIYKKMVAAKQKNKPLTKKDKEEAWRVINEQIRLNNEINALPLAGPNSSETKF